MPRVLVVRLGSLGDLVHTLPAVAAVRRALPDAQIDWLVDAGHVEFLALVPAISSIVPLDARTASAWLDVRKRLRASKYDIALDFQGLIKSAALARISGAKRVLGFDRRALREPAAGWFYTEQVMTGEGRHVIQKNLTLAAAVGASTTDREFPLREVHSAALDAIRTQAPGRFALLNCGAAWPNKRWPAERFGHVAAWLRDTRGLSSVVLWGPGERLLAEAVVAASDGAAIAAPPTTLTDLVACARAAALMISGDTGPTHIAAAVGTPIVALFGPTTPGRNGPWDADDISLSRYDQCSCHYQRRCRRDDADWCLRAISEDDVRAAAGERLDRASRSGNARLVT